MGFGKEKKTFTTMEYNALCVISNEKLPNNIQKRLVINYCNSHFNTVLEFNNKVAKAVN